MALTITRYCVCSPSFILWIIKVSLDPVRPSRQQLRKRSCEGFVINIILVLLLHTSAQRSRDKPGRASLNCSFPPSSSITAFLPPSMCFRTQIHFTVAIDFTASNGECFHCSSLSSQVRLCCCSGMKQRAGFLCLHVIFNFPFLSAHMVYKVKYFKNAKLSK